MFVSFEDLAEPFKAKCLMLDDKILAKGLPLKLFETRRSFKRQAELFGKGRDLRDGLMVVVDKSKVVTGAQAGQSPHNWGLAADFILDVDHTYWKQWNDRPESPWDDGKGPKLVKPNVINVWHQFGMLAREVDLTWGGSWRFLDLPHVELPTWKSLRPQNYKAVVEREMSK